MGSVRLRADFDAARVRRLAKTADDADQVRRLLSIAAVYDGMSREDAARIGGMDRQTLRDWVHRSNAEGLGGLASRVGPGPSPLLNGAQMAELLALVVQGPDPEVDKVVRWRCVDLRAEVASRFSVQVHEGTIGRWLNELGLTRLQPRPVHPQKDPEAEAAFKKTSPTWSEPRSRTSPPPVP